MAHDRATELAVEQAPDELALEHADAGYAIQRLLERGYLYEVDGELFVTEPDAES